MNSLKILTHSLRSVMLALRAAKISKPASMSDADIAGGAHGIATAVLATRWQRRTGVPAWTSIYAAWESDLPPAGKIDAALYGSFDPADRFELLTSNKAAFEKRADLYRGARRTIDLSTYYIQADGTGRETVQALIDCARRGVRVRVVADAGAMGGKNLAGPDLSKIIAELRGAGVEYRAFRDPARPWDACHRKLLIVDGTTLVTGGRNYADHYSGRNGVGKEWRDIDLLLTGPSVARLQTAFEDTFAGRTSLCGTEANGSLFQPACPADIETNASFIYLLQCIRAARETLDIENAYYFNHPSIHRQIQEACRRGVRVRVLTNSAESNDLDIMNYRLYAGFPGLIDAGVSLYLRQGKGRTLHCKYFVADGEWVGFGSSNLDFYSPRFCLELGIHVRDRSLGQMLTSWFDEGLASAERLADKTTAERIAAGDTVGRTWDRWFPDIQ